jgi:putative effector of murein hydrolase LrgA (UPF0299 family)
MTVIAALTLLLSCQLAGELAARALALPVPGPVLGLALLFAILLWRRRSSPALDQTADLLLANLSLLFVPAGVGIVQHWHLLADRLVPILVTVIASTLLAVAASAAAYVAVAHLLRKRPA